MAFETLSPNDRAASQTTSSGTASPGSTTRFCVLGMLKQPIRGGNRIDAAGRQEPAEFDEVDSPFAIFDLCDPAMRYSKSFGQLALRDTSAFPCLTQFRTKCRIFFSVCRFFHCSDYGRLLGCSQNRYTMLMIHSNWRVLHGGATVAHMLRRIKSLQTQTLFEKHLVGAALEIFAEASRRRSGRHLPIVPRRNLTWQINDVTYKLFPTLDDDAMYSCEQLGDQLHRYIFIVPPNQDSLLRYALRGLVGDKFPSVFSINSFISWRMTFDSHDLGQDSRQTFLHLVKRYNERVRKLRIAKQLLIRIPRRFDGV
jgi:hypothetical protein